MNLLVPVILLPSQCKSAISNFGTVLKQSTTQASDARNNKDSEALTKETTINNCPEAGYCVQAFGGR